MSTSILSTGRNSACTFSLLYVVQVDVIFWVAFICDPLSTMFYVRQSWFRKNVSIYSFWEALHLLLHDTRSRRLYRQPALL